MGAKRTNLDNAQTKIEQKWAADERKLGNVARRSREVWTIMKKKFLGAKVAVKKNLPVTRSGISKVLTAVWTVGRPSAISFHPKLKLKLEG